MNAIGNRHIGANVRLMIVNNGCGAEFHIHPNMAANMRMGDRTYEFTSAGGHFGQKSKALIRHYAEDLGFIYMSASTKEEYLKKMGDFITPHRTDKPIVFEIFTQTEDESKANEIMRNLEESAGFVMKGLAKGILGTKNVEKVKRIMGK